MNNTKHDVNIEKVKSIISNSLLIRGGRVIDPANEIDKVADVLIVDGKIAAVGEMPNLKAHTRIN